jgi:hypothetical protein
MRASPLLRAQQLGLLGRTSLHTGRAAMSSNAAVVSRIQRVQESFFMPVRRTYP